MLRCKHCSGAGECFNTSSPHYEKACPLSYHEMYASTWQYCDSYSPKEQAENPGTPIEEEKQKEIVTSLMPKDHDMVNKPEHYDTHVQEEIDIIRFSCTPEEFNGYLKGNMKKYMDRCGGKDPVPQELNKVVWHAMFMYMVNGGTLEGLRKTMEYMENKFKKEDKGNA